MNATITYWMRYSIDISKKAPQSGLRVGVVLVSEHNELICSSYTGEEGNASWCSLLLERARGLRVSSAQSIYITINTLSVDHSFDLINILREVSINEIYVGLPDPDLELYLEDDPIINFHRVYRYPDELQREILEQNDRFYADSKQSVKHSPYYFQNRISDLVIEKLKAEGFAVSKNDLNENKNTLALATLLSNRYRIEYSEAINVIHNAISEAFNKKYAAYDYSDDTRSLDLNWKKNFISFYKRSSAIPMSTINILNVGVGGGHEAVALFSDCPHITFVDIVHGGLERIKGQMPLANIMLSSADDLFSIPDHSQDLYVSLRTYNSSFFNIKGAISEARRVLKTNAVIIISVANGFLYPGRHCIIPGLIVPGTEFVDLYRGIDTIKLIHTEFLRSGFENIQIFPTSTEIYISAIIV